MNRNVLLGGLVAVLLVVLFWLLVYQPRSDEVQQLHEETLSLQTEQQRVTSRIRDLEEVREEAPALEAQFAAARQLVPSEPGLPSLLRQLQLAADEANLTLVSVTPARPELVNTEAGEQGLHRIGLAVELEGGYFQLVDFLRRIEDPAITPRALLWNRMALSGDPAEHPTLQAALQGELYAVLPAALPETPETDPEPDADPDAAPESEPEPTATEEGE